MVEKIPGFAEDTTREKAPVKAAVDEPQPLKEKLLNPNTLEEVAKPHREISKSAL